MAQDYWGYSNNATANKNLLLWNTDFSNTEEPSSLYGANCNPNFDYAVSGALKKITYPTKGYTNLFYEANTAMEGGLPVNGGGIRIKKTVSYDNNNSAIQTSYNYTNSYFTNAIFTGTFDANVYNFTTEVVSEIQGNGGANCSSNQITIYPEKVNVSLGSEATFVANEEVEEYKEDGLGNRLGKKKHTFSTSVDPSFAEFPVETVSASWKRGQLLNQKTYSILPDNSEVLIQEQLNTYTELLQPYKTRGFIVRISFDNDFYNGLCKITGNYYCDKYSEYNDYVFVEKNEQSSVLLPTQTTTTIYDQNGQNPVQNISNSEYDPLTLQITKQTDQRSDGTTLEMINKYPNDFGGNAVYDEMVNRYIFSPTIETEQKENSVSLKKIKTNYKQWYPSTDFGGVNGFFAPLSVETQELGGVWETEVMMGEALINPTQNGYDLRSRPIVYTEKNGLTTYLDFWNDTGKTDLVKKKTVNDQYIDYDYEQVVGLTSNLDQNSLGNNFTYDVFKRLKIIKDQDLKIIDKYSYFYSSGGSTTCTTPFPPTISITNSTLCDITLTASGCSNALTWSNGSITNNITVSSKTTQNYTATCADGSCVSSPSNTLTIPPLPSIWASADIGSANGCTQNNAGNLTLQGNGSVGGSDDIFHWIYKPMTGDFTMITKISNLPAIDGMRSGIMIRSNTSTNAQFYTLIQDGNANVGQLKRDTDGGTGGLYSFAGSAVNQTWIKIIKTGNSIKAFYSTNANPEVNNAWNDNFSLTGTAPTTINFGTNFLIGLVTYGATNQTTFSNITINGNAF